MHQPPEPPKKASPPPSGFAPTLPMNYAEKPATPRPAAARVNLDLLESRLLTLREEMRVLHARLETLNLMTRLGVKPGKRPDR